MRCIKSLVAIVGFLCMIVACERESREVFLEKDGTLYEIADQVSFYYPKEFELNINNDNKEIIQFVSEKESFYYTMEIDDTDNYIEDRPELYAGQLEEDGAKDVHYKSVQLESAIECHEFTGSYVATGMKFKHIVYFSEEATFIYIYQAPQDVYDDHIVEMTQYLESLTVHKETIS